MSTETGQLQRGVQIFVYQEEANLGFPDYLTRKKIDKQIAKQAFEHIIIFINQKNKSQIWQWVSRQPGQATAYREVAYHPSTSGQILLEKLNNLTFMISDEEGLTITGVTERLRDAFDKERVTRSFYDRFKDEHKAFLNFIKGIPDEENHRWYASVMLNRLMFIYFVQKKGFLDSNTNYLNVKLQNIKVQGSNIFYKAFLCPLFFEGFAKKQEDRSPDINQLLGRVPYLNGGLFMRHQIEELYGEQIDIEDSAFDRIFNFFDQYQWHLDDRPMRADNEINPDVLGYIFEKYINQKQMGAYYTKEDITEYISKNTTIPFLFDEAKKKCKIAFEGNNSVWSLLKEEPEKYIYDAVKKGVDLPLPEEITIGIDDVTKRTEWNKQALAEYALPTEIWREVVARRQRYEEVHKKLSNEEIKDINEFITYNLNIRQFAQDVIENSEGPELIRAFYYTIAGRMPEKSNETMKQGISVLDPTCGSGAFLFAAMNILEPLHEACLDRMRVFVDELELSGNEHHPEKYSDFKKILEKLDKHKNPKYFIYKSIILNNLFGVDIMEEAVEICKLRLFLKLVAQIDDINEIEPLPDIDFNIRAGNTLIGFTSYGEVEKIINSKLDYDNTMARIEQKAEDIDRLFDLFRRQQTSLGGDVVASDKQNLWSRLKELEEELNHYLAQQYGIENNHSEEYAKWKHSHKPFHWFIEFHSIIKDGGFDVIIGNPPYVEYSKVRDDYKIMNYATESCGNLYAFCVERCTNLVSPFGKFSFIVLMASIATVRMSELRNVLVNRFFINWIINLAGDWHPGKLFEGVRSQFSIITSSVNGKNNKIIYSTNYKRWFGEERESLFAQVAYTKNAFFDNKDVIPKFGNNIERIIWLKIAQSGKPLIFYKQTKGLPIFYRNAGIAYYLIAINFSQKFFMNGKPATSSTLFSFNAENEEQRDILVAILNSNLFAWYYFCYSDCYHINALDFARFRFDFDRLTIKQKNNLLNFANSLMVDIKNKSKMKVTNYKTKGIVEYQEFYPRYSKLLIDEIDKVLAEHFSFTNEELDFIINYDIKYRMGIINSSSVESD